MRPRRKRTRAGDAAPVAEAGASEAQLAQKDQSRSSDRDAVASADQSSAPRSRQGSKRQRLRTTLPPRDTGRNRRAFYVEEQEVDQVLDGSNEVPTPDNPRSQENTHEEHKIDVVDVTNMPDGTVHAMDINDASPLSAAVGQSIVENAGGHDQGAAEGDDHTPHRDQKSGECGEGDASGHVNQGGNAVPNEKGGDEGKEEAVETDEVMDGETANRSLATHPSPLRKSAVLETQNEQAPLRTQALLELLRNDEALCDAVIVVGGHELKIHRAIVAPLSPYFSAALSGGFCEARDRRLVIGDASPEAMSIILDYAYGVEIEEELSMKPELALEVWKLAHRFAVDVLRGIAAREALSGVSVESSIRFFREAEVYGSEKETEVMFIFIARNFFEISQSCEEFCDLSFEFLLDFLCSKELIVSEWEKFQGIMEWVKGDLDQRTRLLYDLLHYVRFPLLKDDWIRSGMKDVELLPKDVLSKAMMQGQHSGHLTQGYMMELVDQSETRLKNLQGWPRGTEFMMGMRCNKDGMTPKKETPFYFELLHWVISARIVNCVHGITLDFEFEQRVRGASILDELNFEEDIQQHEFMIHVRLCSGGQVPEENLWFKTPKTRGGKARLILMEKEVASVYFKDRGRAMDMLVAMQCRKKIKLWARGVRAGGRGHMGLGPAD